MILACMMKAGSMIYIHVPSYKYESLIDVMTKAFLVGEAVDIAPNLQPKDGFKVLKNSIGIRTASIDIIEEVDLEQLQSLYDGDMAARKAGSNGATETAQLKH